MTNPSALHTDNNMIQVTGRYICALYLLLFGIALCNAQNKDDFSQIKDEANKLGINLGSSSWSVIDKNERIAIYKESRILSPIQISIIASVLRPNVPNTPILSVDQPQN